MRWLKHRISPCRDLCTYPTHPHCKLHRGLSSEREREREIDELQQMTGTPSVLKIMPVVGS